MDKEDDLRGFEDPTNSHLSLSGRRHSFGASGCLTDDFLESVATLNKDKRYYPSLFSSCSFLVIPPTNSRMLMRTKYLLHRESGGKLRNSLCPVFSQMFTIKVSLKIFLIKSSQHFFLPDYGLSLSYFSSLLVVKSWH